MTDGMLTDPTLVAAVISGCLLGGFVKGVSGSGLPQIAVPLIALTWDVPTAVALVQFPALSINLFQVRLRGHPPSVLLRQWPIVLVLFGATIIGVGLLRAAPPAILFAFMGVLTLASVAFLMLKPQFTLPEQMRIPAGLGLGLAAGISAGLSSLAGPFLIPYFLSLRLHRDVFVSVVSLCYIAGILPTVGFFLYWNIVPPGVFALSLLAIVPALAGMWCGNFLRARIDEAQFRRIVLVMLIASSLALLAKAVAG